MVATRVGPPASTGERTSPSLRRALLIVAATTVLPGVGHLVLGRRRTGSVIVALFLLGVGGTALLVARAERSAVLRSLVSDPVLVVVISGCLLVVVGWTSTIVRTYLIVRPPRLTTTRRVIGAGVVVVLCVTVAAPLGAAASLAGSQRALLDEVFPARSSAAAAGQAPAPLSFADRRLNVLLLGSDAAPGRDGARTDTMIVASVDTRTAQTILFALPRNIQHAPFPAGSAMADRFPDGFTDPADPASGSYLLNAVSGYGSARPELAPPGPTSDPGVNTLMATVTEMLGLRLDHYLAVDMAGLAAVVDALGGVSVDVGTEPLPIGGLSPSGRRTQPEGYLRPGVQSLDGDEALWFVRSRRDGDDYERMGRQRCLIDAVLAQNSPTELLVRFRSVASAASSSVRTDIPRSLLPALVELVDEQGPPRLRTVSFDPDLPAAGEPDGNFRPARPDIDYMREVVDEALSGTPARSSEPPAAPSGAGAGRSAEPDAGPSGPAPTVEPTRTCAD